VGEPTQIASRGPQICLRSDSTRSAPEVREASWMLAQGLPVSSRNQTLSTFLTSWLEAVRHRILNIVDEFTREARTSGTRVSPGPAHAGAPIGALPSVSAETK
jgi:hypothetical protein